MHYRGKAYLLHEFVVMPDHFHALITPLTSLEKALQFIKGGFSHRAKIELGSNMEIWQRGFSDHRIRDFTDYGQHVQYARRNPVKARLVERAEDFQYSSARPGFELDPAPQGLKPLVGGLSDGTAEAVPLQSIVLEQLGDGTAEAVPLQSNVSEPRKIDSTRIGSGQKDVA